uniref:Lrp/AsnC family transcriptional regulator n=1 Tax=Ignisphaera aggregans TaxID=334771 RepID=A0A7C2VMH0_9CREN
MVGHDIDDKDLKILARLARNARTTYADLAREVGLSDVAVIKRVKRLENRIIKRYTLSVDPSALGYRVVSITGIDVDPDKLFNVMESLKVMPYLRGLWLTTGDHQLVAVVWASDEAEAARVQKEISEIDGVKRVCPSVVLKTIKDLDMGFYIG